MKIAVTGANGFLGTEVCRILIAGGHELVKLERYPGQKSYLFDLEFLTRSLIGVQVVIHLAARAHVLRESVKEPLAEFRQTNVEGAVNVARAAVRSGVRRMVFVSSIGVLGNRSDQNGFSEESIPAPAEPYSVSKWEAEQKLEELASEKQLDLVIVRPPLVYGPNVRGNFLRLLRLVNSGMPLPFGSVHNCRSFIGVTNLAELLVLCAIHPRASGQLFLASDNEDISLPDLLARMARLMGRPALLLPCPVGLLKTMAMLVGKNEEFEKLVGTLRVHSEKVINILSWQPTKDLEAGIADMVTWYKKSGG